MDDPLRQLAWLFEDDQAAATRAELPARAARLANELLAELEAARASELHVDPTGRANQGCGGWSVRLRVDGRLRPSTWDPLPPDLGQALVQRFKLMAGWRPEPLPTPTDGHLRVRLGSAGERRYRVWTVPARRGEALAVRVETPRPALATLEGLDLHPGERRLVEAALTRRRGLILVAGPRGSGRRTFVRACLGLLAADGRRSVAAIARRGEGAPLPAGVLPLTLCDWLGPTLPAAVAAADQAAVDALGILEPEPARRDLACVLRTAASRLVLLVADAADAAAAVAGLKEGAVLLDPLAPSAALKLVVSLRLAPRLCRECKAPAEAPPRAEVARLAPRLGQEGGAWRCFAPRGCPACGGTGRRGRVPVAQVGPGVGETLQLDGDLREELSRRSRRTLRESALALVRDGEVALADALAAST